MELLYTVLVSAGSVFILFFLTKLIGNKQMSQLNLFDYVNGITIGSIAAEMATSERGDYVVPLIAMLIYGVFVILIEYVAAKSMYARRFFNGRSVILYDNGKLYKQNIQRARLNINDLLMQCRISGYFDLTEVQTIVMEADGRMSILPRADIRPVQPRDLQIFPKQEQIVYNVIEDGVVLKSNLRSAGRDAAWLHKMLFKQGIQKTDDVFLATLDSEGTLRAYLTLREAPKNDPFS